MAANMRLGSLLLLPSFSASHFSIFPAYPTHPSSLRTMNRAQVPARMAGYSLTYRPGGRSSDTTADDQVWRGTGRKRPNVPDKRLPATIASEKRARIDTPQQGKTPGSDSSSTNKLDAWIAAAFNDLLGNLRTIGEKDGIEQLVIGWNSQINRDHASHKPPFRLGRPTF